MSVIKPQDVEFVFDNTDGTTTVGIGYDEPDGKGGVLHKIKEQVVSRREGNELAKLLKKLQKDRAKIEKEAGAPPPTSNRAIDNRPPPKIFRAPNGRPITMDEIMNVKKRS